MLFLHHYLDKKKRNKEEMISLIEYHALLTSFNPKAVAKAIAARKKQSQMAENLKENPDKYLKINQDGENEFGQHVNTTFFADLEKYGGPDALKGFENPKDYHVEEKEDDFDDEDAKFIKEARKAFSERESEMEEEEKFKKEHPELFTDADSVTF